MPSLLQTWALPVAILLAVNLGATWSKLVSEVVPEPYLDEFFHVPQAQKYCIGDYSWDPKITTPPGLYLLSKLLEPILGCDTSALRSLNSGAICLISPLVYRLLRLLRPRSNVARKQDDGKETIEDIGDPSMILDAHSALNITLFPPLFFFSALYYTDVISTLLVLMSYDTLLRHRGSALDHVKTVVIGIAALSFRQTNIFWVAIFPAGVALVNELKRVDAPPTNPGVKDVSSVLKSSWDHGTIYDCSIEEATPQDYILFLLSVALGIPKNVILLLRCCLPYIALLALFTGFVVWNGGVVLGDKTAHTATIHIPQMLYMWPYIAFFSLPLIIGPILRYVTALLPTQLQDFCEATFNTRSKAALFSIPLAMAFFVGGLVVVHFNTIVHPYTLADNRHFVFYVFRILRRDPSIKYLAVPIYFACMWLVLHSLGRSGPSCDLGEAKDEARPMENEAVGQQPCQVSFIIIWLATTTLSVITAPLVEPRYFIIPWIIWRLHLPYLPASLSKDSASGKVSYDPRIAFETIWMLAINAGVSYIFLHRGFAWPSEPGKVQRFMW